MHIFPTTTTITTVIQIYPVSNVCFLLPVVCLPPDVSIPKQGSPVHQSFQYSATNMPWRYFQIFTSEILFKMSTSSRLIQYIQCTGSFVNKKLSHLAKGLGTPCQWTAELFTLPTYFRLSLSRTVITMEVNGFSML